MEDFGIKLLLKIVNFEAKEELKKEEYLPSLLHTVIHLFGSIKVGTISLIAKESVNLNPKLFNFFNK